MLVAKVYLNTHLVKKLYFRISIFTPKLFAFTFYLYLIYLTFLLARPYNGHFPYLFLKYYHL